MAPTLLATPLEIFIEIIKYLDFDDIANVKYACKGLCELLSGESINRNLVENHIPHSKEAALAQQSTITYSTAFQQAINSRNAFRSARPYSAVVLGRGACVLYRDGHVFYSHGNLIRILNVYETQETELVFDFKQGLAQEAKDWVNCAKSMQSLRDSCRCTFLDYQDSNLSFILHHGDPDLLIVLDVRRQVPVSDRIERRIRCVLEGQFPPQIRVRQTARSLYAYSRFTGKCLLQVKDLENPDHRRRPYLGNLFGLKVGYEDIVFKIFDGWVYLLSSYLVVDPQEPGLEGSYYHCYRFPADGCFVENDQSPWDEKPAGMEDVRVRRAHVRALPTNKATLFLDLLKDERTGTLMIVEKRQGDNSHNGSRAECYHFQPLIFPEAPPPRDHKHHLALFGGVSMYKKGVSLYHLSLKKRAKPA